MVLVDQTQTLRHEQLHLASGLYLDEIVAADAPADQMESLLRQFFPSHFFIPGRKSEYTLHSIRMNANLVETTN
jgi:hypothetical protein